MPGIATQSIGAGLLGILKEILAYGICGLCAKHNLVYNVFLHEPFFAESLNRAVLAENRSIKADLKTCLCHLFRNVNYLAWPDPRARPVSFTPTLQKSEGLRVKASEGEVVVLYFEPSATQNLKTSGFPEGETTWQNRSHPSNSLMEVSKNLSFCYDISYNCGPLSNLWHVVYATRGLPLAAKADLKNVSSQL